MKLSEALEHCINTGLYDRSTLRGSQFMCHALRDAGYPQHAQACQEKVNSLGTGFRSLGAAMDHIHDFKCDSPNEYKKAVNQACLDFFHKWIEELKEQGL